MKMYSVTRVFTVPAKSQDEARLRASQPEAVQQWLDFESVRMDLEKSGPRAVEAFIREAASQVTGHDFSSSHRQKQEPRRQS